MVYKKFTLRVFRGLPGNQYWEEFELPIEPRANIISSHAHPTRTL